MVCLPNESLCDCTRCEAAYTKEQYGTENSQYQQLRIAKVAIKQVIF